jgi:hypothetical protein
VGSQTKKGCVWRLWPTFRRVTTTLSRQMKRQEDLHGSTTGFTSCNLLPCVWSQSCCHLAKIHWWRAVLSPTRGHQVPGCLLLWCPWLWHPPLILAWPGIHAKVILKSCLESVC